MGGLKTFQRDAQDIESPHILGYVHMLPLWSFLDDSNFMFYRSDFA